MQMILYAYRKLFTMLFLLLIFADPIRLTVMTNDRFTNFPTKRLKMS